MEIFCDICQKITISNRNCKKCGEAICSVCGNLKTEMKNNAPGSVFKTRINTVGPERLYFAVAIEVKPEFDLLRLPAAGNENNTQSSEWALPGTCGNCLVQPRKINL